jgi:hypothetical protein
MSRRNGNRARFHIDRKRKLRHRQRLRALLAGQLERRQDPAAAGQRDAGSTSPRE